MSYTIQANDVLEIKSFCRQLAQTGVNVLHYFVTGVAGGSLTDQQVVDGLSTTLAPLYKAMMSNQASYSGLRVQKIKPAPVTVAVVSTNGAGVGTTGTLNTPPQTAMLMSKRTAFAGRANRGRMYISFPSDSYTLANGGITAGGITAATALANTLFASITVTVGGASVTLAPIIYQKATGTSVFVTNIVFPASYATQRRRSGINRGDSVGP